MTPEHCDDTLPDWRLSSAISTTPSDLLGKKRKSVVLPSLSLPPSLSSKDREGKF